MALGLGTGYWSTASQTLWQIDTAALGLSVAMLAFAVPGDRIGAAGALAIGAGLAMAGATRPQLGPVVAVVLAGTWARSRPRDAAAATAIVALAMAALCAANQRWFGHPLGALPLLQDVNARVHGTQASFRLQLEGFAGLLVSPSRGLLVFSPVVLVVADGVRRSLGEGRRSALPWCVAALAMGYAVYGSYAVWWGGHTYGPRYLLDLLPVAVPLAAAGVAHWPRRRVLTAAGAVALAWSIAVSATGAFCYPNDRWNVDPSDIDRDHTRLWSVSDNQIRRCWSSGASPQNYSLLDRAAVRRPGE